MPAIYVKVYFLLFWASSHLYFLALKCLLFFCSNKIDRKKDRIELIITEICLYLFISQ